MSAGETTRYPVDFDAIGKGYRFTEPFLTELFGVGPEMARYSAMQAELASVVEKQLALRGRPVTVRREKAEIVILEDSPALERNTKYFRLRLRGLKRTHYRTTVIDQGKLSPDERRKHDRELVVQAAILSGIVEAQGKHVPAVYKRNTPGLPASTPTG